MDEMNKMFEEQGFEVDRKWLSGKNCYEFHIRKGDIGLIKTYTYPCGARPDISSKHQRDFVYNTITEFKKYVEPRYISTNPMDIRKVDRLVGDGIEIPVRITDVEMSLDGTSFSGDVLEPLVDVKRNDAMSAWANMAYFMTHYDAGGFAKIIKPVNKQLETNIKDVIFNPPATIVMWDDGTKTVVKAQGGDEFDAEKGLAMAISKKALGNDRKYYHTFIHWLKRYEKQNVKAEQDIKLPSLSEASANIHKLQQAIYEKFGMAKPGKVEKKRQCVQKAYDLLVKFRDTSETVCVDEVIGYLGEALED